MKSPLAVEQAQAAVMKATAVLSERQRALSDARAFLDNVSDAAAVEDAMNAVESLMADCDRHTRLLEAAKRRLETAQGAAAAEKLTADTKRLLAATAERSQAAAAIDKAFADLRAAIDRLTTADSVVAELNKVRSPSATLGSNYGLARTIALLRLAAFKHRLPNADTLPLNRDEVPSTVAAVEHDNATILLDVREGE